MTGFQKLPSIIANGNAGHQPFRDNWIECNDGFRLSVIAGGGAHCTPRPVMCLCYAMNEPGNLFEPDKRRGEVNHDYPGPYIEVEVGFPSQRPEPWDEWEQFADDLCRPTDTTYGYVPVQLVTALVALHGGEKG